jgi:hypothetical protein
VVEHELLELGMSVSSLAESSALRLAVAPASAGARSALPTAVSPVTVEIAAGAAADAALAGWSREAAVEAGTSAAGEEVPPSVGTGALTQLVSFIPTETLALYVAVDTALGELTAPSGGLVCRSDFGARWWWLAGLFVATAVLCIGLSYRKQKEANPAATFRMPLVEILAGSAGFLIWALALPSTPLRTFCGYDPSSWSPVILLAGTVSIATTLYVFGKTVNWTKVLKS